jgi:hypothetical protein
LPLVACARPMPDIRIKKQNVFNNFTEVFLPSPPNFLIRNCEYLRLTLCQIESKLSFTHLAEAFASTF